MNKITDIMKRTLLLTLIMLAVISMGQAQTIKEDAHEIAFFEGIYDYDYLFADNTLTSIDKKGNISHEITLKSPSDYTFKALVESENDLTLLYHKSSKKADSIVTNRFPKTDLTPAWKPSCIMVIKAKKIDYIGTYISPDKTKMAAAIGYRTSKKGKKIFEVAVVDKSGAVLHKQNIATIHENKRVSHIDLAVNNDGMAYLSYFQSYKVNKNFYYNYCLYTVGESATLYTAETLGLPWVPKENSTRVTVSTDGDLIASFFSYGNFVIVRFDNKNKQLSNNTHTLKDPYTLNSSFNDMYAFSSPVKGFNYILANSIYEMGDGSFISLSEATGESHKETTKTQTRTTTDKNGRTYTTTYTTVDRTDYRTYAGDILIEHIIINGKSIDFHNADIIDKKQRSSGEYSARRFENKYQLSFTTDMHNGKITVLFREGHWYSKTITIGEDKSINVSSFKDWGFYKFTNSFVLYDDYWIVYRQHGKKYDVKLMRCGVEKPDDDTSDTSDESPEFDD